MREAPCECHQWSYLAAWQAVAGKQLSYHSAGRRWAKRAKRRHSCQRAAVIPWAAATVRKAGTADSGEAARPTTLLRA